MAAQLHDLQPIEVLYPPSRKADDRSAGHCRENRGATALQLQPGYTGPMPEESSELAYYRSVEDLFSSLRGGPHVLSPRDFQLLRGWWRDGVPFAAVAAGLNEVFERARERDEDDPVVSLSYCRHAVRRQAKRFAAMRVGNGGSSPEAVATADDLARLSSRLEAAARSLVDDRPAVSRVLERTIELLDRAADDVPAALLDEHLYSLESAMLRDCWQALDPRERSSIDARVDAAVTASIGSGAARRRAERALRDRELRVLLGLPRLELGG